MSAFRAGFVAILGRPNAGKSTLLNALLGEKLAIVTDKPQTTRSRILGIKSVPGAQILFVDTPGLHASERTFNAALNQQAEEAAGGADVVMLLADLTRGWNAEQAAWLERWQARKVAPIVVGTKLDLPGARETAWPPPGAENAFRVSARDGEGIPALLEHIASVLPESPALYPEDEISDRPLRFLVAELVREAAFDALEQELPYSIAVEVESYDESREDLVRIRANLIVERESQKPIVIGRGGSQIKKIGIRARQGIEELIESRVHLELRVKVEPKWTKKPARVKALGYV